MTGICEHSNKCSVTGICEHSNKCSSFIKSGKCIHHLTIMAFTIKTMVRLVSSACICLCPSKRSTFYSDSLVSTERGGPHLPPPSHSSPPARRPARQLQASIAVHVDSASETVAGRECIVRYPSASNTRRHLHTCKYKCVDSSHNPLALTSLQNACYSDFVFTSLYTKACIS